MYIAVEPCLSNCKVLIRGFYAIYWTQQCRRILGINNRSWHRLYYYYIILDISINSTSVLKKYGEYLWSVVEANILIELSRKGRKPKYTTQNLLRITFSFNDLMLKTNRLKKDFF